MLKDCIEIFARELEKTEEQFGNLEKFILDSYIPADGDYIVVQKDGTLKSRSFKLDKKTRTLNGMISGSQLDDDIKFYDYHSRLVSKDKPQDPKKAIHSNNYLSFWIKWNKLDNMELVMQAIDRYYDVLKNPKAKYKNIYDAKMYDYIAEKVGDVDQEKLEYSRNWIKQNIFKLKDMGIELTGKNYLKIFFEDDKELYVREEQRYLITKLFNKNDYSTEIDGQILGPPNDNLTLNPKKPYMEHKTRKIMAPYLLTTQNALVQRMFFDYLMNEANKGNTNLFFDNSVLDSKYNKSGITALKNGEFIEGDFSGFFLQTIVVCTQKGDILIEIEHQDTIVDYKYNLYKPFVYSNVLEDDVTDEQYRKYGNKKELLAVINEVLFSKWLSGNFFSDEEQIKKINIDSILKKNIFLSRDAIFAWLYKGQSKGIESILHLVSISIIKSSITNGYIGKAVKQFNLMKSLDVYFGGNDMKEEKDRYINIRSNLRSKINQDGDSQIESESEYYYAVGQLVRYYISLNKSKDKNHSLANPFIYVANEGVLKKRLEQLFKKYNYAIKINYNRYNKLYAMIIAYMTEGKVNSEDIIAGYLSDNLIYDSKKSEEEN
ncbi:MAG: type I-B CRISPR-associated protein Cas8b/Csh1 [Eubacterium sp.]|nr:type I-B CRISPR-associated protein Cas8b/Csh1 [Eubacterium sp.]